MELFSIKIRCTFQLVSTVPEEEYTEELWNEQKKAGERNRSAAIHK